MESLIKEHLEAFGIAPVLIGLNWNDPEETMEGIAESIDNGIPYNELDLLSDKDRELYESGKLVF